MPYKDPEKQREAQRKQMRRRRVLMKEQETRVTTAQTGDSSIALASQAVEEEPLMPSRDVIPEASPPAATNLPKTSLKTKSRPFICVNCRKFETCQGENYGDCVKKKNNSILTMDMRLFNLAFLAALESIPRKSKHLASSTGRRHPYLRRVLLHDCQDDIKINGFDFAKRKWQHFILNNVAIIGVNA